MKSRGVVVMLLLASAAMAASPSTDQPPNVRELLRESKAARKYLIATPTPEYPRAARQRRAEGSGLFRIWFDSDTGRATSVQIVQSTGHGDLDRAALIGFRKWQCRPGTVSTAVFPVTFTMRWK